MRERAHTGSCSTILRLGRRGLACAALALGAVLGSPAAGFGDTAPVPFSASVPKGDPSGTATIEQLASRIASHIAGRSVSVRCASEARSTALATRAGGSTRLAPEICWPLRQFAEAATRPTGPTVHRTPAYLAAYDLDAVAILTLARESVHLGGVVGSSRANCLGMQWVPYIAEQLGATPSDAQAIARWARAGHTAAACSPVS